MEIAKAPIKGEGGGEEIRGALTAGAQGRSSRAPKAKPKNKGIEYVIDPGTRTERGYPVTKDEIWLLGSMGVTATGFISLASALFGYYLNVTLSLAFAQDVSPTVVAWYDASRQHALIACIISFILGAIVALFGVLKANAIINRTKFEDELAEGK